MYNIKVTISRTDEFFGISTYSREHGRHGRFLVAVHKLYGLILHAPHLMFIDTDCGHYLECTYHPATKLVWFKVVWLNYHSDDSVHGICQRFCVPSSVFLSFNPEMKNQSIKLLRTDKPKHTRVIVANQDKLSEILSDKLLKRAFIKAVSHHFQWGGGSVTLYPCGTSFDFVEETAWGHGVSGGLILHDGFRRSHTLGVRLPMQYYAVHT